jgi:hypothetical protein
MFFPESMHQYTVFLAPVASLVLVVVAAIIANAIYFPSILGNALIKVVVHAPIYFAAKIGYLMYRVWPVYLKQTTTPSVTDFVVRRARDTAPAILASAALLLIVALVANAVAHRKRGANVWASAIVFALAYAAIVYGAYTSAYVGTLIEAFF